jgi:magnesium-transporting ATPase (P-type)
MAIGYYTHAFESAISPWTTLGPLALVISFSLLVEGSADFKRHKNDAENNHADCTVLIRADELELLEHKSRDTRIMGGKDTVVNVNKAYATSTPGSPPPQPGVKVENVKIAYQKLRRMDIRQGHYVLVKNREMVPADLVLLASSNDHGSAYIETSSIDGETNLKLRNSPQLPKKVVQHLREAELGSIPEKEEQDDASVHVMESIQAATKRLARISYLGHPHGRSALEHPMYNDWNAARKKQLAAFPVKRKKKAEPPPPPPPSRTKQPEAPYIAALTTEAPNANVHVFQGRLSLPPVGHDDETIDIPLDADNVLLRGAVIRNTEWVIGVSMYTGKDTRLVRNSFETRSKFSQLDQLMNWCVVAILCLMILFITYLASMATYTNNQSFDQLWYIGWNKQTQEPWPYLPGLGTPKWRTKTSNWVQYFCMYITLLSNFIPLSMYVTVELITFMMLWFVQADKDMYDDTTNTRSIARSTIITDLGRIQYIFSDKTGTLTQNVMRFKRCSVDGMVFGAPIPKSRPTDNEPESEPTPFYPLRQLLVGQFRTPKALGLENLGGTASSDPGGPQSSSNMLTFNAEMFLRVLSLCHTVVVEKDIDKKEHIDSGLSVSSSSSKRSKASKSFFGRKRSDTGDSGFGQLSIVSEDQPMIDDSEADNRGRTASVTSLAPGQTLESMKSVDGAPYGYAYQAESPDEGALVSAASNVYGFQVVSRDSTGIRMKCTSPSHLQNSRVVKGLQSESLSLKKLAAETAAEVDDSGEQADQGVMDAVLTREPREEVWAILAVNKFDSDRKRMSILLRAPAELGGLAILFCKGADSAMLEPGVASSNNIIGSDGNTITRSSMRKITERNDTSEDELVAGGEEWDMAQILGLQAHLGDFGTEGLRTLVLGMKVLTEDECARWLEQYKAAATAMTNRSELLTKAAIEIERDLHVVGATAIEDKLQKNVPNTIATLAKAGIKLWVLTGDKRETAVEIGYSTHVLTDKMHISEVPDTGKKQVSAMIASEFIRLVKRGKLADFQNAALDGNTAPTMKTRAAYLFAVIAKCLRLLSILFSQFILLFLKIFGCKSRATKREALIFTLKEAEMTRLSDVDMRRRVRHHAEKIIKEWIATEGVGSSARNGQEVSDDESLASEDRPEVFVRADSARSVLKNLKETGRLPSSQLREVALQALTVKEAGPNDDFTIPEDALSVESFMPGNKKTSDFDKRKRTMLERLFAIDRDVRKGLLKKHMKTQALQAMIEESRQTSNQPDKDVDKKPRAIVIEGAALKHLLDPKEPELSQMLFAVASNCDAVIACRASPKQKAELLNLVRHNIKPEPITLAIGDGANDVGMIQEAHVGVGISGKEGKQAVNASDFAIPQFRFLEDLILVSSA